MLRLQRLPASRRTHLSLIRLSSPFFIFHDFLALVARDVIFLRGPIRRWKIADAAEGNECFIEVSAASIHSNDLVRHFHTRRPFPDKKIFLPPTLSTVSCSFDAHLVLHWRSELIVRLVWLLLWLVDFLFCYSRCYFFCHYVYYPRCYYYYFATQATRLLLCCYSSY